VTFKICKVLNADYTDKDDKPIPHFRYEDPGWPTPRAEVLADDASTATLEELVELCDQDAESCNSHPFVGTHRILGAVLFRQYGRESATKTMLFIAERKGLHTMSGDQVPDEQTAYEELGVGQSGYDWLGDYGQ
jgi:hypothetical protein